MQTIRNTLYDFNLFTGISSVVTFTAADSEQQLSNNNNNHKKTELFSRWIPFVMWCNIMKWSEHNNKIANPEL